MWRVFLLLGLLLLDPSSAAAQTFSPIGLCLDTGPTGLAVGDLDGNGHVDIAIAAGRHEPSMDYVWFNSGGAYFSPMPLDRLPTRSYSVAIGDIDGDGDLDIARATAFGDDNEVLFNDGHGRFFDRTPLWPIDQVSGRSLAGRHITLGDLDNDGDLDVFLVTRGTGLYAFENIEAGTQFVAHQVGSAFYRDPSGQEALAPVGAQAVLADLDLDGRTDIVVAARDGGVIFRNEGSFSFASESIGSPDLEYLAVAVGDLDGGSGPDLIFGTNDAPNHIFFNDGSGRFNAVAQFGHPTAHTRGVATADADGDGDLDVFIGNLQRTYDFSRERPTLLITPTPNRVYLNDGSGRLAEGPVFGQPGQQTRGIATGDFNGDGQVDVAEANNCSHAVVHLGGVG